ncbi:Cysteine protease family, partial [Globisporangium splendens]
MRVFCFQDFSNFVITLLEIFPADLAAKQETTSGAIDGKPHRKRAKVITPEKSCSSSIHTQDYVHTVVASDDEDLLRHQQNEESPTGVQGFSDFTVRATERRRNMSDCRYEERAANSNSTRSRPATGLNDSNALQKRGIGREQSSMQMLSNNTQQCREQQRSIRLSSKNYQQYQEQCLDQGEDGAAIDVPSPETIYDPNTHTEDLYDYVQGDVKEKEPDGTQLERVVVLATVSIILVPWMLFVTLSVLEKLLSSVTIHVAVCSNCDLSASWCVCVGCEVLVQHRVAPTLKMTGCAIDLRSLEEELKKLGITIVSGNQGTIISIKIRDLAGKALVRGLRLADQLLQEKVKAVVNSFADPSTKLFVDPTFGPSSKDPTGAAALCKTGQVISSKGGSQHQVKVLGLLKSEKIRWERPVYAVDDEDDANNQDEDQDGQSDIYSSPTSSERVFASQAKLFSDGACSGDVIQGNLGDCWLTKADRQKGDAFWQKLLRYKESGTLMGCSIQPPPVGDKTIAAESSAGNGLYFKHAYALVDAGKIDTTRNEVVRLVKLRNPWGMGEWTRPWSDTSEERTENQDIIEQFFKILKRKVGGNANKRFFLSINGRGELKVDEISQEVVDVNANDGTFFMSYDAWMQYFTHFFAGIDFPGEWHGKRVEGCWNETNCGGNTTRSTWINNPHFDLLLEKRTRLFILLSQEDPRGKENLKIIPIGFHICSLTQSGDKSGKYEMKEPAGKLDPYYRLYKEKDRLDFKKGIRAETLPPAIIPGSADVTMEPGRYCIIPSMYMRTDKDTGKANSRRGEKIVEEEEGDGEFGSNNAPFTPGKNSPANSPGKKSGSAVVSDSASTVEKRRKFEDTKEEFLSQAKAKGVGLRELKMEFAKSTLLKKVDYRRKLASLGFKSDDLTDDKFNILFSGLDVTNNGSIYTDAILHLFERETEEDQMACEIPEIEDDDVPENCIKMVSLKLTCTLQKIWSCNQDTKAVLNNAYSTRVLVGGRKDLMVDATGASVPTLLPENKRVCEDCFQHELVPIESFGEQLRVMRIEKIGASEERRKVLEDIFQSFDTDNSGSLSADEFSLAIDKLNIQPALTEEQKQHLLAQFDTNRDGEISLNEFRDWISKDQLWSPSKSDLPRPESRNARTLNTGEPAEATSDILNSVIYPIADDVVSMAFDACTFSSSTNHWLRTKNSTKRNNLRVFHDEAEQKGSHVASETGVIVFMRLMNLALSDTFDSGGSYSPTVATKVFEHFDSGKSGEIDQEEFMAFLESLGLHLDNNDSRLLMCRMGASADDGSIGFANFMAFVETIMVQTNRNSDSSDLASASSLVDTVLQMDAVASGDSRKRETMCNILQQLHWNTRKTEAIALCKDIRNDVGLDVEVEQIQRLGNAFYFREVEPGVSNQAISQTQASDFFQSNDDSLLELKCSGDALNVALFSTRSMVIPELKAFSVSTICNQVASYLEQRSGATAIGSIWTTTFAVEPTEAIDQRDFLDILLRAGFSLSSQNSGHETSPLLSRLSTKLQLSLVLDALRYKNGKAKASDNWSGFVTFNLFTMPMRYSKIQEIEKRFDQALFNLLRLCQGHQNYLITVALDKKDLVVRVRDPIFKFQMDFVLDEDEFARVKLLSHLPMLHAEHFSGHKNGTREQKFVASPNAVITATFQPEINEAMLSLLSRLRIVANANTTTHDHRGMIPFLKLVESDRFVSALRELLIQATLPFFWSVSSKLLEFSIDGDYFDQLNRPSFQHVVAEALPRKSSSTRTLVSLLKHTSSSPQVRYEVIGRNAVFVSSWEEFQSVLTGHQDMYAIVEVRPQGDVFATEIDRTGASGAPKWNSKKKVILKEPSCCDLRIDRPVIYTDTVKVSAVPGGHATKKITFIVDDKSDNGHFVVLSVRKAQPSARNEKARLYCTAYDPFTSCEYAVEGYPPDWPVDFFANSDRSLEKEWTALLKVMSLGTTLTPKVLVKVFNKQAKTEKLLGECEIAISSAIAHEGHIFEDWFPLQHPMDSLKTTGFVNLAVRFDSKKASELPLAIIEDGTQKRRRSSFVPVEISGTALDVESKATSPAEDTDKRQLETQLQELKQSLSTAESAKRDAVEQVKNLKLQLQQASMASTANGDAEVTRWKKKLDQAIKEQSFQQEQHDLRMAALREQLQRVEESAQRERESLRKPPPPVVITDLKQASLGMNASAHDILSAMKDILVNRCLERPYNGLKKALAAIAEVPGKVAFAAFDDVLCDFGLNLSSDHRKTVANILDPEMRGRISIEDFFIKLCGDAEAYSNVSQVRPKEAEQLHIIPTPPRSDVEPQAAEISIDLRDAAPPSSPTHPMSRPKKMSWKEMKKFLMLNLPDGWETRFTEKGKPYFCNHSQRSTQWKHPKPEIEAIFKEWLQENGPNFSSSTMTSSSRHH